MTFPGYAQCLENISRIPGGKVCSMEYCYDASNFVYTVCHCQPPYMNGCTGNPPPPGCCAYTDASPIFILRADPCYCCCGMIGSSTVDVGAGEARRLDEIAVGDAVRAALDPALEHWALVPARFSAGAGSAGPGLQIRFGDPHELETVAAEADQLFLVENGRLKRASRLVAGQDRLTRPDGSHADILDLTALAELGPRHRIATSDGPATDCSAHLIVVNGLVCGDYALQLADLETSRPELMAEDPAGADGCAPPGRPE